MVEDLPCGATKYHLARAGVAVTAHDQEIRCLGAGLREQALGDAAAARHLTQLGPDLMADQMNHELGTRVVAGAPGVDHQHELGQLEQRNGVVGGARRLAREAPAGAGPGEGTDKTWVSLRAYRRWRRSRS